MRCLRGTHFLLVASAQLFAPSAAGRSPAEPPRECPAGDRPAAREATLAGRQRWSQRTYDDLRASLIAFDRAIAADPCYAPAWAGRAGAYALLYDYPRAKQAAMRALELDASSAEAHASLGFVLLHGEWDWPGARRHLARALELDPSYPIAHAWYAIWLETSGRTEEAVSAAQRAAELDPDSPSTQAALGYRLFWARRYEAAATQLTAVLQRSPILGTARYFLGRTLVEQGKFAQAEAVFAAARAAAPDDPNLRSALGYLHARSGRRREALAALRELEGSAQRGLPFASQTAGLLAALGREQDALVWLERGLRAREGPLVWLRVDPRFDSLRDHPRFHALCVLQSAE